MSSALPQREEPNRDWLTPQGTNTFSEALHVSAFGVASDWVTRFHINGRTVGGEVDLMRDARFERWLSTGVQVEGKRILELGPLEGAHTATLCRYQARHVVSVEGRRDNFIKCCVVKNALSLDAATFVLDDISNVTMARYGVFDIALVSGVLYHLPNPARLLAQLSELTPVALIWTHVATDDYPRGKVAILRTGEAEYRGKWYREPRTPLAGLSPKSFWPYPADLCRMFADSGFEHVDELAVDLDHSQGAAWLGVIRRDDDTDGRRP